MLFSRVRARAHIEEMNCTATTGAFLKRNNHAIHSPVAYELSGRQTFLRRRSALRKNDEERYTHIVSAQDTLVRAIENSLEPIAGFPRVRRRKKRSGNE